MKTLAFPLLLAAILSMDWPATCAQTADSERPTYKTSLGTITKLGLDLQRAIKPQYRDAVQGQPISIEPEAAPLVKLQEIPDEPTPTRVVAISEGFIDLINHVAHAKAIDKIEKGYFQKYILILSRETGDKELQPLPNDSDPRYWTDDMKNEQYSNFNSIVGVMMGIKMANHYLGHYRKYASRINLGPEKQAPLNTVLTPKEWDEALKLGVRNALDAGCTIEGVLPFFQSFEKMPQRPAWTAFFAPDSAKYRDIRKILEKLQKDFFAGKD